MSAWDKAVLVKWALRTLSALSPFRSTCRPHDSKHEHLLMIIDPVSLSDIA